MAVLVGVDPLVARTYPGFAGRFALVRGVHVTQRDERLEAAKKTILADTRLRYQHAAITEIPEVVMFRSFYRAMGVDASRFRSPPEYLLRRVMADRFPSVNNLVDVCLLLTVRHWVAVGAFDLSTVKGRAVVAVAKGSENIRLMDGRTATLTPGELMLKDDEKILSAYTLGDARVSAVTETTREALVTFWNVPGIPDENLSEALAGLKTLIPAYTAGVVQELNIA